MGKLNIYRSVVADGEGEGECVYLTDILGLLVWVGWVMLLGGWVDG